MSKPARSDTGFTLLEVLIAVFVLGTVLGSLVTLVGGNLARLSDARAELLEMRLAEQRIRELEDEFQNGPYRVPLPPGYEGVEVASPLFDTPESDAEVVLRRVEVRVFPAESEPNSARPVVILIPEPLAEVEVPEGESS